MTQEITTYHNQSTGDTFSIGGTVYLVSDPQRVERRIIRFYRQHIGGISRVYAVTDTPSAGEQHLEAHYLASFTDAQREPAGGQVQPCPKSDADLSNIYLTPDGFKKVDIHLDIKEVVSSDLVFSITVPDYVTDEYTIKAIAWKFIEKNKDLLHAQRNEVKREVATTYISLVNKD